MAEINIERKQRNPWIWLAALAALALLVWFIMNSVVGRRDRMTLETASGAVAPVVAPGVMPPTAAPEALPPAVGAAAPAAVAEYLQFAAAPEARGGMGVDHDYTARGLTRLAAAIDAVAMQDTVAGGALRPQLDELRQRAAAIQSEPTTEPHALKVREAFLIAASLIDNMRERRFPNVAAEATALSEAATAVQAQRRLIEQRAEVQQFFDRAGAALRAMTAAS